MKGRANPDSDLWAGEPIGNADDDAAKVNPDQSDVDAPASELTTSSAPRKVPGGLILLTIGGLCFIGFLIVGGSWQEFLTALVIVIWGVRNLVASRQDGRTKGGSRVSSANSGGAGRAATAEGRAAAARRAAAVLGLEPRQTEALAYIYEHHSMTLDDFRRLCPEADDPLLEQDLQAMVGLGLMVPQGDEFVMT